MVRSVAKKVMRVGRATVFLMGLALMLALVFGIASTALGANGGNFILGSLNNTATAITKLTGTVGGGPALQVSNPSTATGSTALDLQVATGKAPMKVNRSTKVTNLNADRLDGTNSTDLVPGGVLPAGTTIRGHYEMDGNATAASQLVGGESISFGYKLRATPIVQFIPMNTTPPAGCPGTATSPEASPGTLCIYERGRRNLANSAYPAIYNTDAFGANMYISSANADQSWEYGSWAVTQPAAQQTSAPSQQNSDAVQQRPSLP